MPGFFRESTLSLTLYACLVSRTYLKIEIGPEMEALPEKMFFVSAA